MSQHRKPIPPPQPIPQPKKILDPGEAYPIPFMLADQPRIFLNFLALHSAIPERYREIISIWMQEYNTELAGFIMERYGLAGAYDASLIAVAQFDRFMEQMVAGREEADNEMFEQLEGLFKDDAAE